jgi:hypothetical protein
MAKAGEKVIEVGVISSDESILRHVRNICLEFDYTFASWPNLEAFMDAEPDCKVVITNTVEHHGQSEDDAAECCQAAKGICNEAYVVCVVQKSVKKEHLPFLKKSGADLILLDQELTEMSKLEFLLTQELRARYIPIKVNELWPETSVDFHIYSLLAHRSKFLPCFHPGTLSTQKFKQLQTVSELYINRRDIGAFKKYVDSRPKQSAKDMLSRCRARFLNLCAAYSELVFLLTDQAEQASFEKGAALLTQCKTLCSDLLSVVGEFENVWEVVDNSAIGNMGSVERSTAVATYVGVFGLGLNISNLDDIMVGALLSDIGLLFLHPRVLKALRMGQALERGDLRDYGFHPLSSVNLALERKLQVVPKLRKIIEMTHERFDEHGFPMCPKGIGVPFESFLIQFCQELDSKSLVKLGEVKRDPRSVRAQFVQGAIQDKKRYGPEFCSKLQISWGSVLVEGPKNPAPKKNRIVIIDDEVALGMLIHDYLTDKGVSAEYFADPLIALQHILKNLPNTLVIDLNMPKLKGIDLLKKIQSIPNYQPKVILMSGNTKLTPEENQVRGNTELLQKPFNLDQLLNEASS